MNDVRVRLGTLAATVMFGLLYVAAAAATVGYFETPSKNIVCGDFVGTGYPPLLECGVASGLVPPPPRPTGAACHVADPVSNRIRLNATGRTYSFCAGDVGVLAEQERAPVLGYGHRWHIGPYSCNSAITGLTCRNTSDHGFFLSRQSWHSF